MQKQKKGKLIRFLFSFTMILAGLVMSLWDIAGKTGEVLSNFGLAFVIAGVASMFHDLALMKLENEETSADISDNLEKKLSSFFASKSGIQLVTQYRRGWDGYYLWAIPTHKQNLFFLGRSVLHRINDDFNKRSLRPAAEVILRKLKEGSNFKILFLDPRTDILNRLIKEEINPSMLEDIATSLGICKSLFDLLDEELKRKNAINYGSLSIKVYDEVPYFAYHRVDESVYVGFYFAGNKGYNSGVYELVDNENKKIFENHFDGILGQPNSTTILELNSYRADKLNFNIEQFEYLREFIAKKLGEPKTSELMNLKTKD